MEMTLLNCLFFKLMWIHSLTLLQVWLLKVVTQLGHYNSVWYLFCYWKSSNLKEYRTIIHVYIKQSQNQALNFLMDLHFIDVFNFFDVFKKKFLWVAITKWASNSSHYSIFFIIETCWFKKALDIDHNLQDTETGRMVDKDIY